MRLLLDTHALLWWLSDDDHLGKRARRAIVDATDVLVSVASVWEVSIKRSLGRLRLPDDWTQQLKLERFGIVSIELEHAVHAGSLPLLHRDPFDRMLVAQALSEDLVLVSSDRNITQYNVPVIPAS